jgi:hypothetical protein
VRVDRALEGFDFRAARGIEQLRTRENPSRRASAVSN